MPESPIFVRTYDLLLWLVPKALRFPREHRFGLAERLQRTAYALQRALLAAALSEERQDRQHWLQQADVELHELRLCIRLSHDLSLLDRRGFEHAVEQLAEIGRLLGGWQKKVRETRGTNGPE